MSLFRNLFFAAALAGLLAGLVATVVHAFGTVPIILAAETFEASGDAAPVAHGHSHGEAVGGHDNSGGAWAPADGMERTAYTALADILTGIGCALLLCAAFALRGRGVDWRQGLYWGLGGFAAFTVAPGLGLPPELPGTEAAALFDRQVWWIVTVAATAGGLAMVFLGRRAALVIAGVSLVVLPHVIGAPQPVQHVSLAPADMTRDFIVAAVLSSFVFWVAVGMLSGFFYGRFVAAPQRPLAAQAA